MFGVIFFILFAAIAVGSFGLIIDSASNLKDKTYRFFGLGAKTTLILSILVSLACGYFGEDLLSYFLGRK